MKNRARLIPKVGALTLVALHDQEAHRKADAISYLRATFTHEELLQVAYNMDVNHRASVLASNSEINALNDEADQLVREGDALLTVKDICWRQKAPYPTRQVDEGSLSIKISANASAARVKAVE